MAANVTAPVPKTSPKFGNLYGDGTKAVWVGGPPTTDFSNTTLTEPASPMCIRGDDPSTEMKTYARRVLEGNDIKFKRDDPDYSLLSFSADALSHMETHGADSVFYTEGADPTQGKKGAELFTYHSKHTVSSVKAWVQDNRAKGLYDGYAEKALSESALWLINSLDDSLKTSLCNQIHGCVSGPEVWMIIVSEVQHQSLRHASNLQEEFKKSKLTDFKGENIQEYCDRSLLSSSNLRRMMNYLDSICSRLSMLSASVLFLTFVFTSWDVVPLWRSFFMTLLARMWQPLKLCPTTLTMKLCCLKGRKHSRNSRTSGDQPKLPRKFPMHWWPSSRL